MKILSGQLLLACLIFSVTTACQAQTSSGYFSPLSSTAYSAKITELKARTIPVVYTEKKEQKSYAGLIKDRNDDIISDFVEDRLIADTLLLNKCKAIINKIRIANSKFPFDSISVYINRSVVANASCYGEGTLFINLGLFLWLDNDDELALVIGHELSHQFLNHSESRIRKNIELISSEAFVNEMKSIRHSTDGKYERYKKLMKDLVTENGVHSRYKESEADSLGILLIKNAGYNTDAAAKVLLKLDNVDDLFISGDLYNVQEAFAKTGADSLIFKKNTKYHGLSSVVMTMNADQEIDSIKTHPDCIQRFNRVSRTVLVPGPATCCTVLDNNMAVYKERALVELVRYEYEIRRYTLCSHLCLFALKNGYSDPYFSDFLSLCFSGIYNADKKFERFSVTDSKASPGSTLKDLQDLIFNTSSDNIQNFAYWYLTHSGDGGEDNAFAQLMYKEQVKAVEPAQLRSPFNRLYPNSKYKYFFNLKTH